MALRRREEKEASDTRILEDGDFVQELKSDLDDFMEKNLLLSGQQIDIVTGGYPLNASFKKVSI